MNNSNKKNQIPLQKTLNQNLDLTGTKLETLNADLFLNTPNQEIRKIEEQPNIQYTVGQTLRI